MGTYYRYVNFTRHEFVSLSDLRDGGDKENAVLYCAPALAWLIVSPRTCGDGYRGRWSSYADVPSHDIRIVSDASHDFYDMEEGGTPTFPESLLNITPGLLQSLRTEYPAFVENYQPAVHDVGLLTHLAKSGVYELLPAVSASCKCGWKTGPIHGDHRDETLVRIVSDHVNSKKKDSSPREPRPLVYRTELSADDVCDIVEALDEITSDKGREYATEDAPRLRALRDRFASMPGTRGV
jgi:hypothetical protein